jgi:hypothetical protein
MIEGHIESKCSVTLSGSRWNTLAVSCELDKEPFDPINEEELLYQLNVSHPLK